MSCQLSNIPTIAVNGLPLATEHSHTASIGPEKPAPPRNSPKSAPPYDFTYEKFDYNLVVYNYQNDGVLVQAAPTYEVCTHALATYGRN
jgi:hypothetical protein